MNAVEFRRLPVGTVFTWADPHTSKCDLVRAVKTGASTYKPDGSSAPCVNYAEPRSLAYPQ